MSHHPIEGKSPWAINFSDVNVQNKCMCLVVGVALTALTAYITYYCLVNGLQRIDIAYSSLDTFTAGFLIYSGVVFSVVSTGNCLYAGFKLAFSDDRKFDYNPRKMRIQIALSILAPVAAVPALIVGGLMLVGATQNGESERRYY